MAEREGGEEIEGKGERESCGEKGQNGKNSYT